MNVFFLNENYGLWWNNRVDYLTKSHRVRVKVTSLKMFIDPYLP